MQEMGFESGMNGFRWMDFEYAAWVCAIAVAGTCPGLRDPGGGVCDKASGRQARDDIGPTLARLGS